MSLKHWLNDGRLHEHAASAREIMDLLTLVDRDLADALIAGLSPDQRFGIVYNALLQLATIVLRSTGYRSRGAGHHWITFKALPLIMCENQADRADYFDACRRMRNTAAYEAAGRIGESEVRELFEETKLFRRDVIRWLEKKHPDLAPGA